MIISFAYTTPALLSGAKTVTRRDWKPAHAALFRPGQLVDAYDRSPRSGGRKVGRVRILEPVLRQPIVLMPDADFRAEGFHWLHENGHRPPPSSGFADFSWASFLKWRASGQVLYVVRFCLEEVFP